VVAPAGAGAVLMALPSFSLRSFAPGARAARIS
jgi:hypothetical protein